MKIVLYHILLFTFLLTTQISFLDVLFPDFLVPLLILSAAVVWTVSLGFRQALGYLVPLLISYELLASGDIRLLSIYVVLLAYGTSFLSRRMLIENSGLASLFYVASIIGSAVVYHLASQLWLPGGIDLPSWKSLLLQTGVAFLVFFFTKKVLFAFQAHIDTLRSDKALMIR